MLRQQHDIGLDFHQIAECSPDAIAVLDGSGGYLYANPAHRKLFGHQSAPLDIRLVRLVHPDDVKRVAQAFFDMVKDGVPRRVEYRLLLPDGNLLEIDSQASVLHGGDKRIVAISRNVTEQRLAEEAAKRQLREVQAIAKVGTWDWDMQTDVFTWSDEMRHIFGVDEHFHLTMQNILSMAQPDDPVLRRKLAGGELHLYDLHRVPYHVLRPDGVVRKVEISGSVSKDRAGHPLRMVGVCQDISDRESSEEHASMSEESLRTMVENAREYAIYWLNIDGIITSWNLGAERIKGYRTNEIVGKHFSCFFLPEEISKGTPTTLLEHALREGRYEGECWQLRKNGSRFWAHVIVTPFFDELENLQGFSKITHDITERRRAKEDLRSYAERLRITSRRLVEIQETERRLIAGELHDRMGQYLTALGLNLRMIANDRSLSRKPEVAARLEDSSHLLRRTVDAMRNIMGELRPQALDDYGLFPALRLLAAGFYKRTGIRAVLHGGEGHMQLPKSVDLSLFRIAQEALHNVAKHSAAELVNLRLSEQDDHVTLEIRDNGKGFDPNGIDRSNRDHGWGLLIMRERAEAVGAQFALEASLGKGVRVVVEYRV